MRCIAWAAISRSTISAPGRPRWTTCGGLPADRIKIDQSFVRNIGVDPDDEAIVRATIEMAHRLKRAVVAEGVEIEQHLEFLRETYCDELQGYLFCRPLQPVSFDKLLAERQRLLEVARAEPA